jgi:DNA-directed RNA polymerase subunit M/transcription elongation factor TFIIS
MSKLSQLVELYSRRFSSLSVSEDIKGYDYAKQVVEIVAMNNANTGNDIKKGEALKELKVDLVCSNCGKEGAVRMRRQLRSGDEGENVVIMCPNCGTTVTVG